MTAPAIDTTVLEHLAPELECATSFHTGPRRAHYWVDAHGCEEILICRRCLTDLTAAWNRLAAVDHGFRCPRCTKRFARYEDSIKVVPL